MRKIALAGLLFSLCPLIRGQVEVGAAKLPITPDLQRFSPVFMAGFANNRRATGVHDDLWARCLAIKAQAHPVVLCGVDSIGLFLDDVLRIRSQVQRNHRNPVDVIVAATHVHQAPDTMGLWGPNPEISGINEDYNVYFIQQTSTAALNALKNLRPARLVLGRSTDPLLDSFISDDRPPVRHDAELLLLAANDSRGSRIATLVNWANHPEALGSKNTQITADYPAALYQRLEQSDGGIVVFLNGAIGGMQSPLGATITDPETGQPAPPESFRFADALGTRLAELASKCLRASRQAPKADAVIYYEKTIAIPVSNPRFRASAQSGILRGRKALRPDSAIETPVGLLRLSTKVGPLLEIAFVPGELYPELSIGGIERYPGADYPDAPFELPLKSLLKAPYRMLVGLANDEIGYIIPRAEWDERPPYLNGAQKPWYGEVNSVGPEAAPRILDALRILLAHP